jgi:hypothetical protein
MVEWTNEHNEVTFLKILTHNNLEENERVTEEYGAKFNKGPDCKGQR